jgi:hypothetical protein
MLLKPNADYHIYRSFTMTPILSHINLNYAHIISSFNINSNIITQSKQGLHNRSLPLSFPTEVLYAVTIYERYICTGIALLVFITLISV